MNRIAPTTNHNAAAEADHRIGNSLALLGGLVRLQASAIGKTNKSYSAAETRLLLDGIAARISTVAQVHHRLAKMPDGTVAFGPSARDLFRTRGGVLLGSAAGPCGLSLQQLCDTHETRSAPHADC